MGIEAGLFHSLFPSRYISFTLPISSISCPHDYFYTKEAQISVLDSPIQPFDYPKVAAMLVPKHRENNWIFTTEAGHLQLLLSSPGISRLILIGNVPNYKEFLINTYRRPKDPSYGEELERNLYPLLMGLLPKEITEMGNFEVPFLGYEDNVISSVILESCIGPCVGEMLVEDVEIEGSRKEFRRRLRFKRTPMLIQTEIRIVPSGVYDNGSDSICIEEAEFCVDLGVLVHPYLAPMVSGLSLIGGYLQERFESGVKPRCFCIGVGGGALLSFLRGQLGFEVVGVEIDQVVARIAKQYFGLQTGKGLQLYIGDAIEILGKMTSHNRKSKACPLVADNVGNDCYTKKFEVFPSKFDVIMVDLDSSDSEMGISAPPPEFVQRDVLQMVKSSLSEHGILVLNVIPPNKSFYSMLIHELQQLFVDLYEIDCGNEANFVLIASMSSIDFNSGASENTFLRKLKSVISGAFMDSIRKI